MNKNIFVTATDTEVGKTFISSIIVNKLIQKNMDTAYIKPIETGLGDDFIPIDYNFVKKLNPNLKINSKESVPFKFKYPLSPRDSAVKEGKSIVVEDLLNTVNKTAKNHDYNVIEGAGGVYVPITDNYDVIDFMHDLAIPALVVGRCGLGTINHTTLSIKALQDKNIDVKCFILNGKNIEAAKMNAENIERMTGVKCAGIIPYLEKLDEKTLSQININVDLIFS